MDIDMRKLPIIRLILIEIIKPPIGYVHEVGEVIMIQEHHVAKMVQAGVVRVVDMQMQPQGDTGNFVQIAQDYWNGAIIRTGEGALANG